jgi:hypothetical protein
MRDCALWWSGFAVGVAALATVSFLEQPVPHRGWLLVALIWLFGAAFGGVARLLGGSNEHP